MIRKIGLVVFIGGLLLVQARIFAAPDIYTADVLVADRSPQKLQKALPEALEQVLVKLSGNPSVTTLPAIKNILSKVNGYVESYSYDTTADNSGKEALAVHVVFDDKALKQVLQNAGQAIWGGNRPLTLVWVALPKGTETGVLANDDNDPMLAVIKKAAIVRGVPILFPAMDLEDQTNVAQTTSTLPTNDQLQQIAKKYGVDSLLAGTIVTDAAGAIEGEWRLTLNGVPYEWQTSGATISQVVINGLDRAADMMANQLAAVGGKNTQSLVTMQISNVNNLDDYVHVIAELKKLTPVADVVVSDMSNNRLLLKVKSVGGAEQVAGALKTNPLFVADTPVADGEKTALTPDLSYRFEVNATNPDTNG